MKTTLFSVVLLLLLYGRTACQSIEVTVTHTFDDNIMNIGEFKIMDENRSSDIIDWRAPGSAILPAAPLYWVFTRASEEVVDRVDIASTIYKHKNWNEALANHFLELPINGMTSRELFARYVSVSHTTIFNNLEENSDHGALEFLDPWYVDSGGSQPNDYVSKPSPHVPIGGFNDAIGGGVFCEMTISEQSPHYKARFNYLLDGSAQPITTPRPLTKGDYILQGVFTRNRSKVDVYTEHNSTFWNGSWGQGWIPNQTRYANLQFLDDNSSVFGFYKKHLTSITQEIAPTEGNNQRKVAIETKSGGYRHHLLYESGSKIFYTSSSDSGASYNPEVLISDYYHDCSRPSIAVRNEYQYPTLVPAGIYATYVDATASALLIRWTSLDCLPETWVTLDSIPLATW